MGEKKIDDLFSKGPHFSAQKGRFFNFSHCKWSFLIARRSSLQILVFSPRSKFGGEKRPARTGREVGREKKFNFFSKGWIVSYKKAYFSSFWTVNYHSWSLGDHQSNFGGPKWLACTGREDGQPRSLHSWGFIQFYKFCCLQGLRIATKSLLTRPKLSDYEKKLEPSIFEVTSTDFYVSSKDFEATS